jgi:hypothetical protein
MVMSNLTGFPLGLKKEMICFAQHDNKGADSGAGKASSCYIIGISRSPLRGSFEMTFFGEESSPFLSLRGARQGDVAISAQERRKLLRSARNDIGGFWEFSVNFQRYHDVSM